jgi:hypothetical protein
MKLEKITDNIGKIGNVGLILGMVISSVGMYDVFCARENRERAKEENRQHPQLILNNTQYSLDENRGWKYVTVGTACMAAVAAGMAGASILKYKEECKTSS